MISPKTRLFVMALLNVSVMTLFVRLKEKHKGIYNLIHITEHYILPILATAVFVFVLYESVIPPIFPITEAIAASVIYLAFAIYYAIRIKITKPEVARRAGRSVNLVEEEKLAR